VYKLPESVDLVYGAMMEPLSVAVHAVANKGQCRAGMNVLIMGAGPVGLLAMGVAKGMGARTIVAVDINEERLNFAKTYAATHAYIPVSLLLYVARGLLTVEDEAEWRGVTARVFTQSGKGPLTAMRYPS
jgi:threonine dehydrogenase-like Zn-dependent dehydrogenase